MKTVQMGGRGQVFIRPEWRTALLDLVLRPVLERYADEPTIFAWDIFNEPDWIKSVPRDDLRSFLTDAVSLVHATTTHPATVGSAGVRWRDFYKGLGLDFYQVHWYDSLKHQPSLETSVEALGFDRPVILGEYPTRGSKRTAAEIVATARTAGYSGAFFWSLLSRDKASAGSTGHDQAYERRT